MKRRHVPSRGFSLVEVTLALGVAAFALLSILGLLSVGIGAQQTSVEETIATNIATSIQADLRQTPTATAIALNSSLTTKSPQYQIDITQPSTTVYLDESGALKPSATGSRFKVVITLTPPASGHRTATYGAINIGWPATASSAGSISCFVALDRN